jgi:hypothetical protein
VREAGLEPARPKAGDFKSPVATITPLSLYRFIITPTSLRCKHLLAGVAGIEPTLSESKSDMLPLHNTPTKTYMAEAVRFELTDPFESLVFKTSAIDHSTTLPLILGASHRTRTCISQLRKMVHYPVMLKRHWSCIRITTPSGHLERVMTSPEV